MVPLPIKDRKNAVWTQMHTRMHVCAHSNTQSDMFTAKTQTKAVTVTNGKRLKTECQLHTHTHTDMAVSYTHLTLPTS